MKHPELASLNVSGICTRNMGSSSALCRHRSSKSQVQFLWSVNCVSGTVLSSGHAASFLELHNSLFWQVVLSTLLYGKPKPGGITSLLNITHVVSSKKRADGSFPDSVTLSTYSLSHTTSNVCYCGCKLLKWGFKKEVAGLLGLSLFIIINSIFFSLYISQSLTSRQLL